MRYKPQRVEVSTNHTYLRPPYKTLKWWSQWWLKPMTWLCKFLKQYCERGEKLYYKTLVVNHDDILDKIQDMYDDMYSISCKKPAYLIVGRDHFDKLFGHSDIRYAMSFQMTQSGFKELYGMRIVLIPWITGCFCMPDMEDL